MRIAQLVPFAWSSHGSARITAYHIQPSPSRLTTLSARTSHGRVAAPCIQSENERSRSIHRSWCSGHESWGRGGRLVLMHGVLEVGDEARQDVFPADAARGLDRIAPHRVEAQRPLREVACG